jgi:hypothetical protein
MMQLEGRQGKEALGSESPDFSEYRMRLKNSTKGLPGESLAGMSLLWPDVHLPMYHQCIKEFLPMKAAAVFHSLVLSSAGLLVLISAQGIMAQEATARAATSSTAVTVTVNTLENRHTISPYIYGANFPPSEAYITTGGVTLSRWGGNNSSNYNWKLNATNLDNDWYFENVSWNGPGIAAPGSGSFISSVVAAGGSPIMTIPMLSWASKDTSSHSFSVKKYGAQCSTDPYNSDAGDGIETGCSTDITTNALSDTYVSLLDSPSTGDPVGTVYRNEWIDAIKADYGTQPHYYQLDNEPEIWSGTHRDVHSAPAGYDELVTDIEKFGHAIKTYDTVAERFAPVFDSWWYYWNGANSADKGDHGGLDFLPWLLNELKIEDTVAGSRSFDIFDVHAYFNGPSTSGMTTAEIQAAALRETRDWWDSTYVSESGTVNQEWATFIEPDKTVAFVIPRMRAMANSIYPGTPVSFTEWNGALAGEADFSTALVDADSYGILGRERMWGASRWVASVQTDPAYQALLLYRNADGNHDGFGTVSVAATNNASANLFSAYAATDAAGETLTLMVVNKDPANQASVTFDIAGFTPSTMTTYTLSSAKPTTIVAGTSKTWTATQSFAPYSATLIVAKGASTHTVSEEWDLNPDTFLAPLGGTVTILPKLLSGTGNVTLDSATGTGGMTLTLSDKTIKPASDGSITIKAPTTAGLYSFAVTGTDSGGTVQTQNGWLLATVPAAKLTTTGSGQTAAPSAKLTLTATFVPGSSGASAGGVDLLFTTSAGVLSKRIVRTSSTGEATVTLTLPATAEKVTVTAVGPVFWGKPTATFTETVN